MRLLVVEDELDLQEAIAEGLRIEGYSVDTCEDGETAYEKLNETNYDLVILDLNLPKLDGLEVLKKIRAEKQEVKVLILSARSHTTDKVIGLDLGANDYLAKPFDFSELEARIRNLLRWQFTQENNEIFFDRLTMNLAQRRLAVDEKELLLTKKEFSLLEYLLLNQGRVISQEELIEHVWDEHADSFSGAIRVHIATLRKKLKQELTYDPIHTKIGEGYYLAQRKEEQNV